MKLPDLSAQATLDALTSGVVVAHEDTGEVCYVNARMMTMLGREKSKPESLAKKGKPLTLQDLVSLNKAASEKGDVALVNPVLDGVLNAAPGSEGEHRIKLKLSRIPGGYLLYLIDPYSEEQAISQAHSDFVSVVSHEFRTPLTSIKGYADTMLRYGKQLKPEQQTQFISIIKDQADRLTRMVEHLLTASKLGAGKVQMAFRAINLEKMAEKVTQNILSKGTQDKTYAGRTIKLEIERKIPEVWGDIDKFEQVLTNLIDNAVKYSFPDSEVLVKGFVNPEDKERVVITITNTGIGIPEEQQSKIFTKFSRVDNPLTRQVEGTGLGLYITKTMVTSMEGKISLHSIPNETTTFRLEFLVATPERQAEYSQAQDDEDE